MTTRLFRRQIGFTLIELMIVVSIIAILASIAIPKFADLVRKAREGQQKGFLGSLRSALTIYYSDMEGNYPTYNGIGCTGGPCGIGLNTVVAMAALTVNGKYIASLPNVSPPDFHPPDTVDPTTEVDWFNVPTMASFNAGFGGWDAGSNTHWYYFADPTETGTWGQLYISCTHTDSKGTQWSSY